MSGDRFLREFYGQRYVHLPGNEARFADLFPWPSINSILRSHRLEHPRLRMILNGTVVPFEDYIELFQNRRKTTIPKLRMASFNSFLRKGATLVLDDVHELHPPISDLAYSLERVLREEVAVNAYVGRGVARGFDVHWDPHEVFAVQVSGSKKWHVYPTSRRWPLYKDVDPNTEPPDVEPTVVNLTAGDVLYLPRGWWHGTVPTGEPSLHLTFGVTPATGIDLLAWLVDEMRHREEFREDLPRFRPVELESHVAKLLRVFADQTGRSTVERFFTHRDTFALARVPSAMPGIYNSQALPDGEDFDIDFCYPRAVLRVGADAVELFADGRRWTFALTAAPLLEQLTGHSRISMRELITRHADRLPAKTIRGLVSLLTVEGLVTIQVRP
ncbi:cupin domain-containing protein [Actinomadura sp. DC4]|uniref:cupin domain-containing protein n=1 Tax=Actinomadura sp. DC4 TaxID=3055069 RepID=UPI0025B04FBC|nr:cupin domain-containing protein [Actinomadura sp. DC4]MDN3359245.1 cupin domain-containing protein [Actinomadura sp. DC4]